ncbi:MAG TPA: DoxX family protein [Vicinamibacteria bacterium]|nr:DoxX family protein [Vicinamibacteria bacterium]
MDSRTLRESTTIKAMSIFLGVVYLFTGGLKLAGMEMMIESFRGWGYSVTFMYVIGVLEVAGAVMLLTSRMRVYGATLISILMIGAVFTHLRAGEWMMVPGPMIMLALAATVGWAERTAASYLREGHV